MCGGRGEIEKILSYKSDDGLLVKPRNLIERNGGIVKNFSLACVTR